MITRLFSVAERKISAVSDISTKKVDSPLARLSEAPTRQKILSTIPSFAFEAGTKEPICASKIIKAFCRKYVLLPAIFGPVINANFFSDKFTLLGTNSPVAM